MDRRSRDKDQLSPCTGSDQGNTGDSLRANLPSRFVWARLSSDIMVIFAARERTAHQTEVRFGYDALGEASK